MALVTHKPSQGIDSFSSKQAHANKDSTYTAVISQTDQGAYTQVAALNKLRQMLPPESK